MFAAKIKYYHPKFKEELGTHTCVIYDYEDFIGVMKKLVSDKFAGDIKIVNINHLSRIKRKELKEKRFEAFDICIK